MKNRKNYRFFVRKKFFGVKKSKFANRLKRALPKFRGDRSEVRGVNGRSKFAVRPPWRNFSDPGRTEFFRCMDADRSRGVSLEEWLPVEQLKACMDQRTLKFEQGDFIAANKLTASLQRYLHIFLRTTATANFECPFAPRTSL